MMLGVRILRYVLSPMLSGIVEWYMVRLVCTFAPLHAVTYLLP